MWFLIPCRQCHDSAKPGPRQGSGWQHFNRWLNVVVNRSGCWKSRMNGSDLQRDFTVDTVGERDRLLLDLLQLRWHIILLPTWSCCARAATAPHEHANSGGFGWQLKALSGGTVACSEFNSMLLVSSHATLQILASVLCKEAFKDCH